MLIGVVLYYGVTNKLLLMKEVTRFWSRGHDDVIYLFSHVALVTSVLVIVGLLSFSDSSCLYLSVMRTSGWSWHARHNIYMQNTK